MTVEFHPLAAKELGDAALFYEGKARGLGDDFLNEVRPPPGSSADPS